MIKEDAEKLICHRSIGGANGGETSYCGTTACMAWEVKRFFKRSDGANVMIEDVDRTVEEGIGHCRDLAP